MSHKSKFTDAELENLESMGMKPSDIAKKLGVTTAAVTQRQKKRGETKPKPSIVEKPDPAPNPQNPAKSIDTNPFPFEPKDDVIFGGQLHRVRSVGQCRMILCRNADMKSVTIMLEDYQAGRAKVQKVGEKPQIKTAGEDIVLRQRRADEEPESAAPETTKETKPDKTVFEKVAAQVKSDRKPATVNHDFEECFKPIDQVVKDEEKTKQSVEDLFQADPAETAIESAPADAGPLHIDLEMEDSADPVETFRDIDYTDSELGAVEKEISDTVLGRRGYLDMIDQLLDLMAPVYNSHKDVAFKTKGLAISILVAGIDGEAGA